MHSGPEAVVNDPHHSHYTKISIRTQNYVLRQQENAVLACDTYITSVMEQSLLACRTQHQLCVAMTQMDNRMDQNNTKVEICRKTRFHYDNQTILNSPPKNDSQFVVLQMVSRYFQWPYFPIYDKNNPRYLLYREKNKYKHRNGGGNADSTKHCIICSTRFPEITPPPSFTIAKRQKSLLTYCNIHLLHQNYQEMQRYTYITIKFISSCFMVLMMMSILSSDTAAFRLDRRTNFLLENFFFLKMK